MAEARTSRALGQPYDRGVAQEGTGDERLRAALCAQSRNDGSRPQHGSFARHAALIKHHRDGAWYSIGGSACLARELMCTVEAAGGTVRMRAQVAAIRVAQQRVVGVTLDAGERIDGRCVISDLGVHNTLRLPPSGEGNDAWASDAFAPWDRSQAPRGMRAGIPGAVRSESFAAFKRAVEDHLRAQFARHFLRLAPLVRHCTLCTPISVAFDPGAEPGATYGLEIPPRWFFSGALRPRTPIGGFFLAGQDVATLGVSSAAPGGPMAAASVKPQGWGGTCCAGSRRANFARPDRAKPRERLLRDECGKLLFMF
ncbi:MAG: hypothetical protein N2688_13770 [Burkholderiaceae bacterium]|nr:hypothetical protein [Burkholderiaceae bacterium]